MVVVYGTLCIDRLRTVERIPPVGGYAEILSEACVLGGEAANTALALRRWGAEVRLHPNPIGSGPLADTLRDLVAAAGLDRESLEGGRFEAPFCDVYITPDGERTMFGRGFLEMEERARPERTPWHPAGWFTADANHGEAARRAADLAHQNGMRVYVQDFARDDEAFPPGGFWQSSTDWVGARGATTENVRFVADWARRHRCTAILSDGPNGFAVGLEDGTARAYPPYPCPVLVDSTGAGDAFRAGMLYGLDQGWGLPDCLRFAAAAGCLNCTFFGASSRTPERQEIFTLMDRNPGITQQYE